MTNAIYRSPMQLRCNAACICVMCLRPDYSTLFVVHHLPGNRTHVLFHALSWGHPICGSKSSQLTVCADSFEAASHNTFSVMHHSQCVCVASPLACIYIRLAPPSIMTWCVCLGRWQPQFSRWQIVACHPTVHLMRECFSMPLFDLLFVEKSAASQLCEPTALIITTQINKSANHMQSFTLPHYSVIPSDVWNSSLRTEKTTTKLSIQ